VHQPYRLRWFWPDEHSGFTRYFDEHINKTIFDKVASKCYMPTNRLILELIDEYGGEFKVSYSITGTLMDQCRRWNEELFETFVQLADTGCVEFLDETSHHSLAGLFESREEFVEQIREHNALMKDEFHCAPCVFRNTELLYNNSIAREIEQLGYRAILTEGIEHVLQGRSPNYVYQAKNTSLKVLLRNYRLSDDIAYRFSARWWNCYPLTADKWAGWAACSEGDTLNVFMDYETFGEHQWAETGIFEFLKHLPGEVLSRDLKFNTPCEVAEMYPVRGEIDVGDFSTISWADMERDTSAWLGNDMQRRCFEEIKLLEPYVKKTGDRELLRIWRHLQTSDHYYYMCTKWLSDGDVHSYFSIHSSPFDAAVNFMAVVMDFKLHVFKKLKEVNGSDP
jgi:alpha-amylase